MSETLSRSRKLSDMAISLPAKGLSVKIPKLASGFHPVDAVGLTIHIPNLVVYNFFVKGIVSALDLSPNVGGIFLKDHEVWYLAFNESDETVSFACQENEDYFFTFQPDPQSGLITLKAREGIEAIETAHPEDFEYDDRSKLRFLYRALHSKYQEDLISVNCLIPYDEEIPTATLGKCDWKCLWGFQCSGSLVCNSCRWFKRFRCG